MDSSPPDFSHLRAIKPPVRENEEGDENSSVMQALLDRERETHLITNGPVLADWLAFHARQEEQLRSIIEINDAHSLAIDFARRKTSVLEEVERSYGPNGVLAPLRYLREAEEQIQAFRDLTRGFDLELVRGSPGSFSEAIERSTPAISIPEWLVKAPRTAKEAIKEAVQEAMRDLQPATSSPTVTHEHLSMAPTSPTIEPSTEPQVRKTAPTTTATPSTDRSCEFRLSKVSLTEAPPADRERGLIGYISCIVNDAFPIDGVALRRTRKGEYALSFPKKPGHSADEHYYFKPINDAVRQEFLRQVLGAVGLER